MVFEYAKQIKKNLQYVITTLKIKRSRKNIFLINTPEHGNLGDHAIVLATQQFLKDNYSQFEVIEITSKQYMRTRRILKYKILPENVIIINGGGYLGDVWINEEKRVREIVDSYKKNVVIIFPQTIYFKKSDEIEKSRRYYSENSKLKIFTRERNSYRLALNENLLAEERLYCCPDIVLYLEKNSFNMNRKNVLMCFRKDKEKSIDESLLKEISEYLISNQKQQLIFTDTVVEKEVSPNIREKVVEAKLQEFAETKLVITDRLHGMIFSAITGTPCIAFDNVTRKVSGVYKWIEKLDYIYFFDQNKKLDDELKQIIHNILSNNVMSQYQRCEFNILSQVLDEYLKSGGN